jgi:lipoprotein-anchoring transpeptidase ErfK/SrfK
VKFTDRAPFLSHGAGLRMLRIALVAGAAWTVVAGYSADAAARGMGFGTPYGWYDEWYAPPAAIPSRKPKVAPARREKAEPKKETGFGDMPKGPLQLIVSIDNQTVTLFSNGVRVAQGPVSTGVASHPTPMGVFSIIEKDRYHRSNLYSDAPMPYMQRITWSGVALHEGLLPGYPASHGCIRMSHDFARKLWPITKLGVRVVVARHELAPVDFEHPKLFRPKLRPAEPAIAISSSDGRSTAAATMIAQATIADAGSEGTETVPQVSAKRSGAETADDGEATETMPAIPVVTEPEPSGVGGSDNVKPAPSVDPATPPQPPQIRAVEEPLKRSGQVAVFVSRKEQRIFVRQAFIPLFDMPVVIEDADQPLGTHVFTAMEVTENGGGMRWNLITVPIETTAQERREARKKPKEAARPIFRQKPTASAAEALNRIQIPPEAVERISELLVPGSSLVVSDEGLGRETGRYTEFIVLSP